MAQYQITVDQELLHRLFLGKIASRYCRSGTKSLTLLQGQITRLDDRD